MILYSTNAYLKADHDDIDNISLRQILFEKSQKMWYFIVFSPENHKNITFFRDISNSICPTDMLFTSSCSAF